MNLSSPRNLLAAVLAVVVLGVLPGAAVAAPASYVTPDDTGFNPPGAPSRAPSISGVPQVGGVLMGDRGAWSADVTLTSEWVRCSVPARVCETTGDTDLSYTPPPDAAGLVIRLRVVATRRLAGIAVGTRTEDAQSAPIAGIDPSAPRTAPHNVSRPRIAGKVQEGQRLTGLPGEWAGSSPIGFSYGWFSCAGSGGGCRSVSTSRSYTPAHADVGRKLILSVLALNPSGSSSLTVDSGIVAKKSRLVRLAPFPRLIIGGRVTRTVTTISSFKLIRVPRGATISAVCSGRGCPFRRSTVKSGKRTTLRLTKLERRLRSGLTIVVTVRKGTAVGKYTRLRTRRGAAPARIDRCVAPRSSKPIACG